MKIALGLLLVGSMLAAQNTIDTPDAHVAAAKALLDKGLIPDQARYFPYLAGYVAFYGGDYRTALTQLQNADQGDPFILGLSAQAHGSPPAAARVDDEERAVQERAQDG